jgi:hypothetical protein
MPILIDSVDFLDEWGNPLTFYKGNAGDKFEATFNIRSSMKMSSVGNPLTLDPSVNQVQSASISWLEEGFRVGDIVLIYIHNSGGSVNNTFWSSVQYVDDVLCDFGAMDDWYNITLNEFVTMYVVDAPNSYQKLERDGLDLTFNHSKNGNPGSEFSLIDAEVTQINFTNLALLPVGGTANGTIVGNQSGGFLIDATVSHSAPTSGGFSYWQVKVIFVNPGSYDDGTWFFTAECLKVYSKMLWARFNGEPFARYESIYSYEANTGFFNEPNNTSVLNASLVSGISELDYCVPTDFSIVVDGEITELGFGGIYRPIDNNYYRNQLPSQTNLTMVLPTTNLAVGVYNSFLNPTGAGYEIEITAINTVGSVTTIDGTFTPNAQFQSFMDVADPNDRLFYLWIKCGNLNLLAFGSQLTCDPPIGGPLIMTQDYGYFDHCENVDNISLEVGDLTGFIADTEDDVAYFGRFLLDKNQIYESFSVKFEAFNTTTDEDFTLASVNFSFAGVPISGAGVYLLNETQGVNLTLPTTSEKREVKLILDPSIDTPTQFGVIIYAPWLLDWKYWIAQLNASVDFYPTQNKDWEQYDNLGDWTLRTELSLIQDGLAYTHANQIVDREYNAEDLITSNIDLIIDSTNLIVGVIPIGNLMRIKSTHINLAGNWDIATTWGMITVESYESSPRWICSSCVPFDNNTSNPLTPLSGLLINIVFPSPNVAVLECYFDPGNIDLTNGVKITAKIKDGKEQIICAGMIYENDDCILLENGNDLIIE